ncbi:MAG: hypothetical protein HRT90_03645 [Candidatus Margulisbacteria bacterium]|nr:hypothetical protein [Candidatus Margulisiibacteriota bacterium]
MLICKIISCYYNRPLLNQPQSVPQLLTLKKIEKEYFVRIERYLAYLEPRIRDINRHCPKIIPDFFHMFEDITETASVYLTSQYKALNKPFEFNPKKMASIDNQKKRIYQKIIAYSGISKEEYSKFKNKPLLKQLQEIAKASIQYQNNLSIFGQAKQAFNDSFFGYLPSYLGRITISEIIKCIFQIEKKHPIPQKYKLPSVSNLDVHNMSNIAGSTIGMGLAYYYGLSFGLPCFMGLFAGNMLVASNKLIGIEKSKMGAYFSFVKPRHVLFGSTLIGVISPYLYGWWMSGPDHLSIELPDNVECDVWHAPFRGMMIQEESCSQLLSNTICRWTHLSIGNVSQLLKDAGLNGKDDMVCFYALPSMH